MSLFSVTPQVTTSSAEAPWNALRDQLLVERENLLDRVASRAPKQSEKVLLIALDAQIAFAEQQLWLSQVVASRA